MEIAKGKSRREERGRETKSRAESAGSGSRSQWGQRGPAAPGRLGKARSPSRYQEPGTSRAQNTSGGGRHHWPSPTGQMDSLAASADSAAAQGPPALASPESSFFFYPFSLFLAGGGGRLFFLQMIGVFLSSLWLCIDCNPEPRLRLVGFVSVRPRLLSLTGGMTVK